MCPFPQKAEPEVGIVNGFNPSFGELLYKEQFLVQQGEIDREGTF